jgi:mycothiol synthase
MELRAPTRDDAEAVFAVLEARDIADIGRSYSTLGDVVDEWGRSELDLSADARVAISEGMIAAYAVVRRPGSMCAVAPAFEGRGVGARLLSWTEGRERDRGARPHRQWIAATNERARSLLLDAGYALARSYHRMTLPLETVAHSPNAPEGLLMRGLDVDRDGAALHALDAASFANNADYDAMSLETFRESHLKAHDIDRDLTCIAERDGRIVGFALSRRRDVERTGFIDVLAVAPAEQGRGIGAALLVESFARFAAAGLEQAELGVASDNPRALRLYERVGMRSAFQADTYERELDD